MSNQKVDFKKELKEFYVASAKKIAVVNVPKMIFLSITGKGDPNTSKDFQDAIEALYSVAFTIKMMPKNGETPAGYFEYIVPPLEGLWWMDNKKSDLSYIVQNQDKWNWKLMVMQPKFVDQTLLKKTLELIEKKKKHLSALSQITLEIFEEGLSVQTLHVGPYSTEHDTIKKIQDFIAENNFTEHGFHHEIYLSDPKRTAPEKLKTILRQPVKL